MKNPDEIRIYDWEGFDDVYPMENVIKAVAEALGIAPNRLREIAEAEREGQLLIIPESGTPGISFTKPGEEPSWTFRGYPQEDGSFILAICKSDVGTSAGVGELIPEDESDSFHPVFGLRFYQKASVATLKKACDRIIQWFDSQKAESAICSGCVHRGEEICGSCVRNGRGNDTDFYRPEKEEE